MLQALDGTAVRWVSTAIARRLLGVSKSRVYQLVKAGKLASCRIEGVLMIGTQSIDDRRHGREVREDLRTDE